MKPVAFDYVRPASVREAIRILEQNPDAKVLAGGQTLGPMLNLRLAQPSLLVDITRIPELGRIEESGDAVILGACVTHSAIEDGRVPDPGDHALARVARGIAYRAVRTRGTIGGSLAHADPAADWLSLLIALRADILIQGPTGIRELPVAVFVTGPMTTVLATTELVTGVRVPKFGAKSRLGYRKICRKTGEFADAIGVAVHDSVAMTLRLVAGAIDGRPIIIDELAPQTCTDASRSDLVACLRSKLEIAGLGGDIYELNVHAAALARAVDEAFAT